jgi:hypothetical protein
MIERAAEFMRSMAMDDREREEQLFWDQLLIAQTEACVAHTLNSVRRAQRTMANAAAAIERSREAAGRARRLRYVLRERETAD